MESYMDLPISRKKSDGYNLVKLLLAFIILGFYALIGGMFFLAHKMKNNEE